MAKFAKRSKITFPLLSDAGSKTIKAYGILNAESSRAIPHPGTIIVGKNGKIEAKRFHEGYRKRHTSQEIIEAVNAAQ